MLSEKIVGNSSLSAFKRSNNQEGIYSYSSRSFFPLLSNFSNLTFSSWI